MAETSRHAYLSKADVRALTVLRHKLVDHRVKLQTQPATRVATIQAVDLIELIADMSIITSILERLVGHVVEP